MRIQNGNTIRARTLLASNGIRVNWMNVSFFDIEKITSESTNTINGETIDIQEYKLTIKWKFKASILSEVAIMPLTTNIQQLMKPFGLVPFGEDSYININNILIIEEVAIHGPQEKVRVRVVLMDGFEIIKTFDAKAWAFWKSNHS